jgi:hypothetical protein
LVQVEKIDGSVFAAKIDQNTTVVETFFFPTNC